MAETMARHKKTTLNLHSAVALQVVAVVNPDVKAPKTVRHKLHAAGGISHKNTNMSNIIVGCY
jgi:hypothetical protein